MRTVRFRFPKEVLDLSSDHKLALMKSLGEQIGVGVTQNGSAAHEARTMWTPDEVPIIAAMEDWIYTSLAGSAAFIYTHVLAALGLSEWEVGDVQKSFGADASDYLEKADGGNGGFRLEDIIHMNRESRARLWQYVSDGGTYSKEELERLHAFIGARTPSFGPLLEAFAVRGVFLGKLKTIADQNSLELLSVLLSQLPVRLEQVSSASTPLTLRSIGGLERQIEVPPFTEADLHAVRYAEQHAAQYVTRASDGLKWKIQQAVTESRRNRESSTVLRQKLLDQLGEANRDFRRIALTELTDVMFNGYIASLPVGARVMGQGAANACPHCKRLIIGKVFTVSDGPGDPQTNLWVGKTNVGNKVKDYIPTIPLHPHCRCRVTALADFQDVDDEGNIFIRPLEQLIEEYKKKGLVHTEYNMDTGAPKEG